MTIELRSAQFRREREETWRHLEKLIDRVEKRGLRSLTAEELTTLPRLYRAAMSSLSIARSISLDRNLVLYLESLATRSYLHVYANRKGFWETAFEFLGRTLPRTFRRNCGAVSVATFFLIAGAVTGFLLTLEDLDRYSMFVSGQLAAGRDPSTSREELREVIYTETDAGEELGRFASYLFTHNSRVAMLCFALGVIPLVPVFYLLFQNGLTLGAFAALHHTRGLSVDVWGWLLPHGITELFAIVLCGAGGLMLGHALVFPGPYTRRESLGLRGREASAFIIAAIGMLFIAALIEGFFRQLVHDVTVRYTLAAATAAFWALYFGLAGRPRGGADPTDGSEP